MPQFQISLTDYLRADRLHLKPRKKFRIIAYILACVPASAIILSFICGKSESTASGWASIGVLAYLAVIFLVIRPRRIRKIYNQSVALKQLITLSYTNETIHFVCEAGETKMKWKDFIKWRQDKHLFAIYHSDAMYQIIPKRSITESESAEIESALRANVGPSIDG